MTENCEREYYFLREFQIPLVVVGVTVVSALIFTLLKEVLHLAYIHLISRCYNRKLTDFGQWAVVTGGSSGIGKAYAIQLAERGLDVVIISNELQPLITTASEIENRFHVHCTFIHADFTEGNHVYREVVNQLQDKDIGILINCAGILGNMPCKFLQVTESNIFNMIDLHVKIVVQLTRAILPSMLKKKKGIIINVSSLSSLLPFRNYSLYSACKAFSDRFSRAISCEYNNVYIQSLIPYFATTRLVDHIIDTIPLKMCILSTEKLVKNSVSTLTFTDYTTGFWINDLLLWCLNTLLPKIIWVPIYYKLTDNRRNANTKAPSSDAKLQMRTVTQK